MDGGGWDELHRLEAKLEGRPYPPERPSSNWLNPLPPPDFHQCAPVNCGCPKCRDARSGFTLDDW